MHTANFTALLILVPFLGGASMTRAEVDRLKPAAIKTEEVPQVPSEILERLSQYQNVRSASFLGWAPNGNGMLIGTRFGNSVQLHRVYFPEGRREQISFFDEPVSGRFIPGGDDREVLVSMSAGGNENYQVHLLDLNQFRTQLLTDGTSRNQLGPVFDDGSKMVIASNRRNGRDTDLYLADTRRPHSARMLYETDGQFWVPIDWSPDGNSVLMLRYVSINESYAAILDTHNGRKTDVQLPGDGKIGIGALAYSADGESIYISSDVNGEFRQLGRVSVATGKFAMLTPDLEWDVDEIAVDRQRGQVAYVVNEDGASSLYVLEGDTSKQLAIPLGIVSSLEFSPDGEHLGFTFLQPNKPGEAYSLQLTDGSLLRWTYSEVGGLSEDEFVSPEQIKFPSFDERDIPAYYYRPRLAAANGRHPVLVLIHGGPESQYRPFFSSAIQYFVNELGLAVLAPNVRGSDGYGKSYLKLDNGPRREDSVKDIGALLDWIAGQEELDESRVAVIGGSYGGYMVLASLVHYADRLKAGIDIVGIANFITFLENTADYRRDLRRAEYGDERQPEMRAVFERINPTTNADKIQSALLVAHGVNDPRVPFSEADQIAKAARANGRSVWTVYAENEGHGFRKKDNADYLRAVQVMFLKRHLGLEPNE